MDFMWDLLQQAQIGGIRARMQTSEHAVQGQVATAKDSVHELSARLDRLTLACRGMWELLRVSTGLSEQELIAKIRELDLSDGKLDGKVAKTVKKCHECERVMGMRHTKCVYCGADRLMESSFENV